jgi:LysR family carnitine catabolism transcriptional activator
MINLPLRQVSTFVCLAETQSFRRAAERLRLSQPAVSAHIRELERQVGVPLVHRTTRHVSLTPEGRAFAARELAAVHRGRVVVACIVPMMATVIPNVIRRLSQLHPGLEVEIRDVLSGELDPLILNGEADLGIGPRPAGAQLSFVRLGRDDFVAAVPIGHPLATREAVSLKELLTYPIVTTANNTSARLVLESASHQLQQPLRPRFELVYHFSVGRMVEAGHGVTALPRSAVPGLASAGIVTVDIKPRVSRDLGLVTRREYQFSPAAQAFVAALKMFFADSSERPGATARSAKAVRNRQSGRQLSVVASS